MAAVASLFLPGCGSIPLDEQDGNTQATSAFYYQPINPLTVWLTPSTTTDGVSAIQYAEAFRTEFANDATRVSLAKQNAKGVLTFGPAGAGAEGESYSLVVDYIKYLTISVPVRIYETIEGSPSKDAGAEGRPVSSKRTRFVAVEATPCAVADLERVKQGKGSPSQRIMAHANVNEDFRELFAGSMPLYVGVGVRVRADFTSLKGQVRISGLPGLSAEAAAGRISGTLSVQTMGISGPDIPPLVRIPSDLSVASIQAAIESATAVKLKIYDKRTVIVPMVIGFESPVIGSDVVAELTSHIYGRELDATLKISPKRPILDTELLWPDWLDESRSPQHPAPNTSPTP